MQVENQVVLVSFRMIPNWKDLIKTVNWRQHSSYSKDFNLKKSVIIIFWEIWYLWPF